jgi:putative permease
VVEVVRWLGRYKLASKRQTTYPPNHLTTHMNRTLDSLILRYVGYALLFLGGAYLLYLVQGALPVFLLAGLFAYALEPVLKLLERRGYSRSGAVCFVFLVFLLLFMLVLALLASAFQQAQELLSNLQPYLNSLNQMQARAEHWIKEARLPAGVKESALQAIEDSSQRATQKVTEFAPLALQTVLGSLGTLMIYTVVLPIITFWLMLEMNAVRGRALMIVPPQHRRDVTEIANSINELLGRYVRGQMVVCGLFGVLCMVAFELLAWRYEMKYGLVLGVVAGLLYIVPYVGMASIATAAGLTAYLTSNNPLTCAIIAVSCCVVFNLIIDYGISPRVLGKGVGLHPLLVIFALLSGAKAGGIFGMILAVPIMASLRVVLIYLFPQLTEPLPQTPPDTDNNRSDDAKEIVQQVNAAELKSEVRSEARA